MRFGWWHQITTLTCHEYFFQAGMCTCRALFCFVVFWYVSFIPQSHSGFLHWRWGNHKVAPAPVKQPWTICIHWSHPSTDDSYVTTTKKTTQSWAYFMRYTATPTSCTGIFHAIYCYADQLHWHISRGVLLLRPAALAYFTRCTVIATSCTGIFHVVYCYCDQLHWHISRGVLLLRPVALAYFMRCTAIATICTGIFNAVYCYCN